MALGNTNRGSFFACHELETWPGDKITCGSGGALILFDMSDVFAENADGFEVPKGDPMPCRLRDSSSNVTTSGARVVDCVKGENDVDLRIKNWLEIGEPGSIGDDVVYEGTAHHQGRQATGQLTFPADEDNDFNHESEFSHSRDFIITTDERGGGVVPPGASCAPGIDNPFGNGGLHVYATDRLVETNELADVPDNEEAWEAYARDPDGEKAIFRAPINTQPQGTFCTAHVFQQLPVEGDGSMGRIFMGWYTQGTQVIDYRENQDGTFEFAHVGYFIPELANTWVSHVFGCEAEEDGRISYFGAVGDFNLGNGRNAIEIIKATLPPLGAAFGEEAAVTEVPAFCTLNFVPGAEEPDDDGTDDDGTDDDGTDDDGTDDDGTDDDGTDDGSGDGGTAPTDDSVPTALPATGGGLGLIPVVLGLLGSAAWFGRSRRKGDPPVV
jgi:hypothetical protein